MCHSERRRVGWRGISFAGMGTAVGIAGGFPGGEAVTYFDVGEVTVTDEGN